MKKVLLALIPALMLCSCGNLEFVDKLIEEDQGFANVLEDNELHEEYFSKAPIAFGERKNAYSGDIGLGVQSGTFGGKRAVRFIAAVTLDEGDVAGTTAVWTRAVWQDDGDVEKASATKTSTAAYTTLKDGGGSDYTIAMYNAANGTTHTHFVVYTMYDIPTTDTYDGYCITAYVTVDDAVSSKVAATTIDLKTKFLFDKTELASEKYFAVSRSAAGAYSTIELDGEPGSDHAKFTNYDFAKGEAFLFVHSNPATTFAIFGDDHQHSGDPFIDQDGTSQFLSAAAVQNCNVYLNGSDEIWITVNTVTQNFYLQPSTEWKVDSARFAVYVWNDPSSNQAWYSLTRVGESGYYSASVTYDPASFKLIFCRMNGSQLENNWSNKWNQTQDMSLDFPKDLCTTTGSGDNNGAWGTYSA